MRPQTRHFASHTLIATLLLAVPGIWLLFDGPLPAAEPKLTTGAAVVRVPGGNQPVTVELRDMDVAEALRLIGQTAHLSFSINPDVQGAINMSFKGERLDRVLEVILSTYNLHMRQVGGTYVVSQTAAAGLSNVKVFSLDHASASDLKTLLVAALKSGGVQKPDDQIMSDARSNSIIVSGNEYFQAQVARLIKRLDQPNAHQVFRLNYVKAEDTAKLFTDGVFAAAKDSGMKFIPIVRDNALLVVGSPDDLKLAQELITKVDRKLRQVLLDVKLIELSGNSQDLLGVTFDAQSGQIRGSFDPVQPAPVNITFNPLQQLMTQVQGRLSALMKENKARLLASPSIVAMDSKESKIEITDKVIAQQQINVITTATGTAQTNKTYTFDEPGIKLRILPKINPDGFVTMEVQPEISFVREQERGSQNEILATLTSRRTLTSPEVRVKDGETLIMGGLNQERLSEVIEKTPLLGDIPWLGSFFRRTDKRREVTELVVMLTPRIIPESDTPSAPTAARP